MTGSSFYGKGNQSKTSDPAPTKQLAEGYEAKDGKITKKAEDKKPTYDDANPVDDRVPVATVDKDKVDADLKRFEEKAKRDKELGVVGRTARSIKTGMNNLRKATTGSVQGRDYKDVGL